MQELFFQILAAIYGLTIGSFLNVCIYRIPYGRVKGLESLEIDEEDEELFEKSELSIFEPKRSFCPECNTQLAWYNNIPLFSYLFQSGRCAYCKKPIPFRYPFVEILSALCAWLAYISFPLPTAIVVYIFCAALIVISFIDIDYFIIPNIISLPGMVIALVIAGVNQLTNYFVTPIVPGVLQSLIGLAAGAGFLYLVSEIYFRIKGKIGLGFGDVKLLAMTGLLFGAEAALGTIFIGSILGSIIGVSLILIGGHKFNRPLPFGPYLALGTIIYLFFGIGFLETFFMPANM